MTLHLVYMHPNGSACPEFSYPVTGACDKVGTGIHASATFHPHAAMTDEEVLEHFIGPIDMKHLIETGERRRIINPLYILGPLGRAKG